MPCSESSYPPPLQIPSGRPRKCNCKKSKCLKLYCDCFAAGGFCGPTCTCVNCANREENSAAVLHQRDIIRQRNPNAFDQKVGGGVVGLGGRDGGQILVDP